jgi:hypothetical protein
VPPAEREVQQPAAAGHSALATGDFEGIPACEVDAANGGHDFCLDGFDKILRQGREMGCWAFHPAFVATEGAASTAAQHLEGSKMGWYFNSTELACVAVPPGECVYCIPFRTRSQCTDRCSDLESGQEKDDERTEEEEELIHREEEFIHSSWEVAGNFFLAGYMCFVLALLCDDFFVAALDIIIDKMALPPDVAGATFMAAGTSSPELFTACVGVFITHDPVGVGCVVGSAMFNTLCIVGGSAIACGKVVQLDSRIFYRDGFSYAGAIAILYVCLMDGELHAWESWVLLLAYAGYVALCAVYSRITSKFCPKFTHESSEIDIEEMARSSSSWTSDLMEQGEDGEIRMSMAADAARENVVKKAKADFKEVKIARAHRLGRDGGRIVMQRNMLARRLVASILKGELDILADGPQASGMDSANLDTNAIRSTIIERDIFGTGGSE